jgi:hypothetical protein
MLQIKHLGRRTNQPHKANLPKSFICPTHGQRSFKFDIDRNEDDREDWVFLQHGVCRYGGGRK